MASRRSISLVVNLYPFEATVAKGGGLRGVHREHRHRRPGADPCGGEEPRGRNGGRRADGLRASTGTKCATTGRQRWQLRKKLAAKAYARTAAYDAAISNWFAAKLGDEAPEWRAFGGRLRASRCAMARTRISRRPSMSPATRGPASRRPCSSGQGALLQQPQRHGRGLRAGGGACGAQPAVAIIKHANPCGVGDRRRRSTEAYLKALRCDPVSAFGGIVALSGTIDASAAEEITKIFTEVVIAPDATAEAKAIFAGKKNLRLLTAGGLPDPRAPGVVVRSLAGGLLVQSRDNGGIGAARPQGRDQACADRAGARRSRCSPSRWQSTSSRTPSSMRRMAPPSASVRAR